LRRNLEVSIHTKESPLSSREIIRYIKRIREILPRLKDISLSIAVVSDAEMAELNKKFKGKDSPTDVLAFLYQEPVALGEVIISAQQSYSNASRFKTTPREEFLLYLIHGLLHLLGYNDARREERKKMFQLQKKMLAEVLK
jgi:probable rRNA maturation factor